MDENAPPHKYDDLMDTFVLLGDPALRVAASAIPTAVEMVGLDAARQNQGVEVTWQTANETDILGFELLRREGADGEFMQINDEPIWSKTPGVPNSTSYTYRDKTAVIDQHYWYELEVISLNGGRNRYGLVEIEAMEPMAQQGTQLFLPIVLK